MIFHSPRALREVCPKHRNNRREIPAGASFTREAAVFVLFVVGGVGCAQFAAPAATSRSSSKSRMPGCQPGDAGAIPADRTLFPDHTACASLRSRASKTQRARGSTGTPCHFCRSRGSQMGRPRPHKPATERVRFPPPPDFRAARSFRRSPAPQAGEHGAKPWRSTILKQREG